MKGKLIARIPKIDSEAKCAGYEWVTCEVDVPITHNDYDLFPEVVGIEWIKEDSK